VACPSHPPPEQCANAASYALHKTKSMTMQGTHMHDAATPKVRRAEGTAVLDGEAGVCLGSSMQDCSWLSTFSCTAVQNGKSIVVQYPGFCEHLTAACMCMCVRAGSKEGCILYASVTGKQG
jgi:hypothetical protein